MLVELSERVVYYGAALALIVTLGMLSIRRRSVS
jgi:hypothetical protein